MKKFMIFLLMAFLYLGTCQARSEASHPDNAKLKLLSWVTPTPSQSFLTRSADVQEDPIEIAVSIQGPHEACAQSLVTLTAVVNYEGDVSNFHYVWKMDGEALVAGPNVTMSYGGQTISFIPANLFQDLPDNPVTHEFTVEVSYGSCSVTVSPIHEFTIDPETQLEIMIPAFACDNQTSTTITAMLTHGVTPDQYKWLVISHEENADNNVSDTLQYLTYVNELVIDNAVMANADSIGVTPVFNHAACNADTFWRKDLPNYEQMHTLVITGDNAICQNAPATMTATKVEHATYVWAGPDPHVADTTGNVFVTTVPGVYAVTMTDTLNGCDATAQFTITQYGANLQLTANQTVVCAGEPVVLNANLTGFDNQNVAYTWNTGATASTITVFPNADSTIIVTAHAVGIDTTSELSVACTISDTIQIYATKGSKITTQVDVDNNNNSVCVGDVARFTATASDNSVNTYTWYLDGVEIPGENLNILVLTMNDFGIHYVAAKAVVGDCDTAVLSEPKNITVNHIPEISFTGNMVVCNGDTAVVTATKEAGYHYAWSAGNLITTPADTNVFRTVTAGTYAVTVTSATGCSSTASFNVTTFGADLHLTADQTVICAGQPVVMNANLDGFGNENVIYAWSTNDTASTITVTPADTTTYKVTAIAGNCSMVDSITIFVNPTPEVVNITNDTTICLDAQATLTADVDAASYIWYQNGVEIQGQNQKVLTLNFNEAGSYSFTAKAITAAGCVSAQVTDNPADVTVMPAPVVTITGDHYYTTGATVAILTATPGFAKYIWSHHTNDTLTENTDTIHHYGVYTVTAITAEGCVAVSDPFTVNSVEDLQAYITGVDNACQHDSVVLSAVVLDDLEGHTYQWLLNGDTLTDGNGFAGATTAHLGFLVDSLYARTGLLANEFNVVIKREGVVDIMSPVHNFVINPVPVVTIEGPAKICKEDVLTLEAVVYSIGNNAQYQYKWFTPNGDTTINYVNTLTVENTVDGAEYRVVALFQNEACHADTSAVYTVHHYDVPVASTISIDNGSICTTNQATLTITDPNDLTIFGEVTYTWFANGVEIPGVHGNIFTANFDHEGLYTFWAKADYANYPCAGIYTADSITENVNMHPTVMITGDPIICNNDTVKLYAQLNDTVAGMQGYHYDWRLYNYSMNSQQDTSINWSGFSTNLVIAGMQALACLYNLPGCPINVDTTADAAQFLEDYFTSTSFDNADHITVMNLPAQDYPYIFSLVVTTPEGCRVASEPYLVYVNPEPVVVATVSDTIICANGEITATAHIGDYHQPGLNFQWQYKTEGSDEWQNISYGLEPTLTTSMFSEPVDLRVVATQNGYGYNSGCSAVSAPIHIDVVTPQSISSILVVNDNNPAVNICEGAQLFVTAYMLDAEGHEYIDSSYTYMWELNGIQMNDIHGPAFSAQAFIYDNDAVDYTYSAYVVYDVPGCQPIPVASDTVHVRRNPIVTIDGNPNVCYFGPAVENVVLTAWVDGDVDPNATYTWYESGQSRPNNTGYDNNYTEMWAPTYLNPYIFTVEVTNGDGCSTISAPFEVNVYEAPVVNITANSNTICEDGNVTLQANLNNYNDPMIVYQWFENEVNNAHLIPGATHEIQTFQPVTDTDYVDYIVMVTHLMQYIDYGEPYCVAYDTIRVEVNEKPLVTAVNDLNGFTSICEGRTITMTATTTGGVQGGEIYTWYRNGELIENVHDSVFVDAPTTTDNEPVEYVYSVVVDQEASACESNTYVFAPITVNPNPTTVLATDPIVCEGNGDNITLHANVNPVPQYDVVYNWYEDNVLIGTTASTDTTFHRDFSENAYNFGVSLVNDFNCTATSEAIVYVNAQPVVTIFASENQICEGGEVTLTAALNDWNADMLTFNWMDGDDTIAGATSLSFTYVPSEDVHKYTLRVHQITSGCDATSDTLTVVVGPIPEITNIELSQTEICNGGQISITAHTADAPAEGETFTWFRNGVLMSGATAATIFDTPGTVDNNTQQYFYTAIVNRPAAGCVSLMKNSDVVTVYPNPTPVITGDQHVCETDSVFLIANVDTTGMAVGSLHYTWYESGQIRDNMAYGLGDNNFYAEYFYARTEPYRFTVEVSRDNVATGCVATSAEYLVYVYPQPVVNITASETEICENGQVTLTANLNDYNAEYITYQWYTVNTHIDTVATGFDAQGNYTYSYNTVITHDIIPGATQATYTTSLAETTTLGVVVYQTNSTCNASDEITITVNPRPVITEVIAVDAVVCNGAQVIVAASTDQDNEDEAIFTWFRNGIEIEGANLPIFTENVYTTDNHVTVNYYAVMATFPASGCVTAITESDSAIVIINPAPTTVTISGNNVICEGDSTILTVYSDVEGDITWSNGSHESTIKVPAGVYTVTVATTEEEGCEMTSAPFTVEALGTDLIVSASNTNICEGEHTTLYVDQEGWAGNVTYAWSNGSTETTVDVAPATTTTYNVTATVSSTNGSCSIPGSVTINVNPRPATPLFHVSQDVICEGNQVMVYVDSAASFDPTYTYEWYMDGVQVEGNNMGYMIVTPALGIHSFSVKAVSAAGCVSEEFAITDAVVVNPAPHQVSITGDNVICFGSTAELIAHSDVEGTFAWSNGLTGDTINVPAGIYNVTVTTPEGCSLTSPNYTVESFGTDLLVSASATSICAGEHTTLYVNQDGWQGNVSYLWSTGSTATTVDVTPDVTTTFTVTATVVSTSGTCEKVGEVTIIVNPLPVIDTVTATSTVVCEGTQVTFNAPVDANVNAYIWYNNGVEIPGENQAALTVNFNEAGIYNYSVKAISNEGCVSAVAYDAPVVTVNAAPESVVISGNTTICNGGSTVLTANVTPNEAATYVWYKDNVPMDLISVDHITVTVAGSYKVEASFNGCTTVSDAVVVTVEQAPQLQLTATETEICVGGATVITAEATGWNNADVNYNWNNGFQGSSFTFTATTAGTETFIVNASQATSGCSATDTITITVNAIPATPQITVDNATICDGGQVTLQVVNAIQGATYTWYRNGAVIEGATQATITESPVTVDGDATNYVYSVVATLPMSGCESAMSANTIVTVIPTPVVAVSVDGNTTFCQGGTATLHANVTPAAEYNYQWYKDNVIIEGATGADYIVMNEVARETAYNFTVVVTANAGCIVTAAAPAITVVADPVVTATISDEIVCFGGVATLTANIQGGITGVNGITDYTYQWYRNTPTESNQLVATGETYTTAGTETPGNYSYWVVVNNGYNCNALSTPVNFSVVDVPAVSIAVAAGYPQNVCEGGESMLKANVTGGYGTISYQWYKNGNLLVGETNQTLSLVNLQAAANDNYTVEVTQTGVGCSNSASAALSTLITVAPSYTVNITGFGNVCEGGELTLTATVNGVLAGDVLTYQWYKIMNGENAPINGATSATYTTSDLLLGNSYEYFVVVNSSISGCSTISSTVPANVVAAPSVAIQGANTVCEGGNLTLNAFVTGGVEGSDYVYTWNWTGAANGTATTAVPTFVPNVPANDVATPYYFTVTITRADNTGCTATSDAHMVNVLAVPSVSVTADNAYVCQNGDVTLTAHVSPVGAYNYVWTINGQQQAVNAATVTTSMATVGAINATVVVSAANASASCSATATLAVPVQVVAAPSVTISADHNTMCVGGTTTLTANVTVNGNIPGDFSYQWALNGIEVDGAVANTFVQPLNTAGVYTYTLRVSQNNNLGCNSTWSAPVTVQVAEQPVVTLSSVDGLDICEGGSITLTGTVTNYGNTVNGVTNSNIYGAMTFDWTRNGVNVHQDANVNVAMKQFTETLNTIGNYNYQVSVDAAGYNCLPQVSNVEQVSVVGNPSWTDVHVYSSNGTDACLGEMVTLMAAIQGGVTDGAISTNGHIQWVVTDENGNTVEVSGGLGGNSYDIPAAAGTYVYTPTFVGNIGSGCQLTNTGDVQVGVTVHELPTAQFISGDGVAICANDGSASAELVISFTGVAPFVYEVVDGNGNVVEHASTLANTVSIYVSPSEQTTYRISLIQDAYCENTALDANAIATVYVNEIQFETNFFVSGCNDNGQVTISFNMISGNPNAAFTVVYENGLTASGNISNGTATFVAPTVPGDYNAVFTVDGCSYDIVVRVLVGDYGFGGTLPIMDQRWNDVVVVNNNPATNGGHTFVGFQWYHNGVAIPGATYSNYQDKDGLNGFYSVELTEQDANGNMITYMTCEMYFNTTGSVKVYPVPANVRQEITIELDLTSEQLEGAVLDIFSVTGAHVSHVTDLQPITKIEGFKAQGTYFGRILTGTNEIKTVKFVIVK